MITYFPKTISDKGILTYVICILLVSLTFISHAMPIGWIVLGVLEVSLFFGLTSRFSKEWQLMPSKEFAFRVFWTALSLRVIWVLFSYYFYKIKTGIPFEFGAADAIGYHQEAAWLASEKWAVVWDYLFLSRNGYSDSGYALYLTVLYKLVGPNILIARFLKTIYSSFTCVLLYRLSSRVINERVGRMSGLFAMLMPNLIVYCGLHVKETEMLLIIVAFLERTDQVLRSKHFSLWKILLPVLLSGVLFTLRTVLGAVSLLAFITAVVFSPDRIIKKGRRILVGGWVLITVVVLAGSTAMNEIEQYWNNRDLNQESKRTQQTLRGNQWAKYATGSVMAPMIFVMPFSTMVDTDQENQMIMHGGNYVRNFMGVFVLISLYICLFKKKNWRNFALIGSFVIGYLGVISLSGYANAERFLLPGVPCLIIMWAYGISELTSKTYRFVKYWYVLVPIMEIGWAYFKIGSRGLL